MIEILRAVAALIIVMGILAACLWGARYAMRTTAKPRARSASAPVVLGGTWLDNRRKLIAIRWGDKEHLLCVGPNGERRIATRCAQEDVS